MKKKFNALLLLLCTFTLALPSALAAGVEAPENRLEIAFGLFSVALPAGVTAGENTGDALSDFRFETDGAPRLIRANFAPLPEYADTAEQKLDSYLSLLAALIGDHSVETELREETLENGVRLRWLLMRGDALCALCFEAFDDQFGFNFCLQCGAGEVDEDALLSVMRSFRADPEREADLLGLRQTRLPDGAFLSVEHGLRLPLTEEWNPVTIDNLLLPETAFVLEKGDGRWLIQLLYTFPCEEEDAPSLLQWLKDTIHPTASVGEPYPVALEGLGVTAWVADVETGIYLLDVAFVYRGYGYYGMFMWIKPDDAEARPFMTELLQRITAPEPSSGE
ncbi:MAG: hypothetical protein IJS53_05755 [Clostridia bacterium]|nr:hypothetical protein [Clostridia bacterium]